MAKKLVIPAFASEAEEARWLDRHKKLIEREIERRIREGTGLSFQEAAEIARRRTPLKPVTIRMHSEDLAAARSLAASRGIGYQTYIKLLLREALQREAKGRLKRAR